MSELFKPGDRVRLKAAPTIETTVRQLSPDPGGWLVVDALPWTATSTDFLNYDACELVPTPKPELKAGQVWEGKDGCFRTIFVEGPWGVVYTFGNLKTLCVMYREDFERDNAHTLLAIKRSEA